MDSRARIVAESSLTEIAGKSSALFTENFTPSIFFTREIEFVLSRFTDASRSPPRRESGVNRHASSRPEGAK